jgi:hypothetical protein
MKIFVPVFILLLATACGGGSGESSSDAASDSSTSQTTVLIKASGIASPVILFESVEEVSYTLQEDGNFEFRLAEGQTLFDFDVVFSGGLFCELSDDHDLVCRASDCTANFAPVCGKKRFAGVVCVTEPCETARYQTYGNSCEATIDNTWFALDTQCGELEDKTSVDDRPVYITDFALLDLFVEDFSLIEASIEGDQLTVEFEVRGGCGTHDFYLHADTQFMETDPVGLSWQFSYRATDTCDDVIRFVETFDLLPIKESFRVTYPNVIGEQSVVLDNLGVYSFELPFE